MKISKKSCSYPYYYKNNLKSRIKGYSDYYESDGYTRHNFFFEQKNILSLISKKEKSLILDIGCGTGHLVCPLLDNNTIVGIDISLDKLNYAKNRGLRVIHGDGQCLPFRSGSFDVVLCIHVAQLIEDMDRVVAEMARVAKRNCDIIIATLNTTSILRRIFKIVNPNHNVLKMYNIKDIVKILSRYSLSNIIEIIYDYEPLIYKRVSAKIRLADQLLATSFIIKTKKVE